MLKKNIISIKDTYKTVSKPAEDAFFKDKGSKFIGYVFPVVSEEEIKQHIDSLKKKHHAARHWCYAWQLGTETFRYRANDDGEPNNSAGQPIYGQIQSKDLTNVLVVVVRYFGGTKLGVGGLINAYKTTANLILEKADIVERTIDVKFKIIFEYADMNKVMRIVKENNLKIIAQQMELNCEFVIPVRKQISKKIKEQFINLRCVDLKEIN